MGSGMPVPECPPERYFTCPNVRDARHFKFGHARARPMPELMPAGNFRALEIYIFEPLSSSIHPEMPIKNLFKIFTPSPIH